MSRGINGDQARDVCMYNTHKLESMSDTHMTMSNRENEGYDFRGRNGR